VTSIIHRLFGVAQVSGVPPKPVFGRRSSHWEKVRDDFLAAHPFGPACAACGRTADLQVHHIKPYHEFPQLELDPNNLIVLCEIAGLNHHYLFGHLLDWHSWNSSVVLDAALWLDKIRHRP
jgi:5-methylcytosine-specific restriction protein A